MQVTARQLINGAFDVLGVKSPQDTMTGVDMADALRRLNMMINAWAAQSVTMPAFLRESFALVAGQGFPTPYTIGDGGNWDTTRPVRIDSAALSLNSSTPPVEIPLAVLTDDAWAAIPVKTQSNAQPSGIYYVPQYSADLGAVFVWPVVTTAVNTLILYRQQEIAEFPSLSATATIPEGYTEAIEYNLALRLAAPYAVPIPGDVAVLAREAFGVIVRRNIRIFDMMNDAPITNSARGRYNLTTGNM